MSMTLANKDIRENFHAAVATLEQNNPNEKVNLDQLTQGYVRSECTLQVNNSVLTWPVVDTQQISGSPITPVMNLLPEQDSFVVGSLGYWIYLYAYNNGDQTQPNFSQVFGSGTQIAMDPMTFPSGNDNGYGGSSWDPGNMMFWMAYISVEVNKKVLIPYWDTYRHYKAPISQWQGNLSAGQYGWRQYNSIDGGVDTFYPVEPVWVIGGGRQNLIKLNLPSNIPNNIGPFNLGTFGYGTAFVAKAVLFFRGIWAQNSTAVR